MQDLILLLLHIAVQAGDTLERLDQFAARHPKVDLGPGTDLTEAMQLVSGARTALIRCADELAAGLSSR